MRKAGWFLFSIFNRSTLLFFFLPVSFAFFFSLTKIHCFVCLKFYQGVSLQIIVASRSIMQATMRFVTRVFSDRNTDP